MIDLHVHTNKSDGKYSPKDIVCIAKEKNIDVIAITDHDTCDGIEEAVNEGKKLGIKVIPGIEITAFENEEIHILGYNINYKSWLLWFYKRYLTRRLNQEEKIIFKTFKKYGINIKEREIRKRVNNRKLIPTDFDKWLVENGYESDIKEAFKKYFINGELKNRKKNRISARTAVRIIKLLGGMPVLAHPCRISGDYHYIEKMIYDLQKVGLQGIEVYYSTSSSEQIKRYKEVAEKYGLLQTLGSDYHGENISKSEIGHGINNNLDQYSSSIKANWK